MKDYYRNWVMPISLALGAPVRHLHIPEATDAAHAAWDSFARVEPFEPRIDQAVDWVRVDTHSPAKPTAWLFAGVGMIELQIVGDSSGFCVAPFDGPGCQTRFDWLQTRVREQYPDAVHLPHAPGESGQVPS